MVLIPNDLGLRLKLQTEAQLLQPTAPVAEIPADLPELRPGQRFTARILEALPEHTYKALVAGKNLTLSLPDAAKAGDTLELVVIDRSPRAVVAQLAPASSGGTGAAQEAYPYATLSRTGQLLAALQPDAGAPRRAVTLSPTAPLLAEAPRDGAALSQALARAVRQSGLFYESHQAQWTAGAYPLETLLQEPQAQHSDFSRVIAHLVEKLQPPPLPGQTRNAAATSAPLASPDEPGARSPPANATPASSTPSGMPTTAGSLPMADAATEIRGVASVAIPAPESGGADALPEELRGIVQQQLDLGATQRLVLHGEVWPHQHVELTVERDPEQDRHPEVDVDAWVTHMTLTTPGLGALSARIDLRGTTVGIHLATPQASVESQLRPALPRLAAALETAGLQPGLLQVRSATGDPGVENE